MKKWGVLLVAVVVIILAIMRQGENFSGFSFQEHKYWLLFVGSIVLLAVIDWYRRKSR